MKKIKTLNEEISRMKNLFDYETGTSYAENLMKEENEMVDVKNNCISPKETAFKLQNKLNVLLETMLVDVTKQIPIKLGDAGIYIDGFSEPVPWDSPRKFKFTLPTTIKLTETLDVLFNDEEMGKCFKILYDNFPVISNQLNDDTWTLQFNGIRYKYFNEDKKYCKDKMVDPSNLNLNTLDNPFCVYAGKKVYKNVESAGFVTLKKIQLSGAELLPDTWTPETPPPVTDDCECKNVNTGEMIKYPCDGPLPIECIEPVITPKPLVINTNKNYDFDKPTITDDAKKEIDKKVFKILLDQPKDRLNGFINFLKDKEIIVRAYSSTDRDPTNKVNGGYSDCQKKDSTIADYNLCLSQKRADNVVEYLKTANDGLLKDINFTAIGMGENCKSGFCWPSKQHSTEKTQLDRRFTVQFPMWDGKN